MVRERWSEVKFITTHTGNFDICKICDVSEYSDTDLTRTAQELSDKER